MTEQYWLKTSVEDACANCGRTYLEHRQYRDYKPPHCPTVAPMPERKLPDRGVIPDFIAGMTQSEHSANDIAKRRNGRIVEYIPRAQANEDAELIEVGRAAIEHGLACERLRDSIMQSRKPMRVLDVTQFDALNKDANAARDKLMAVVEKAIAERKARG